MYSRNFLPIIIYKNFKIISAYFDSFYFAGIPSELGINEMGVDAVIESTLHIVPNQIGGWATASN